VRRLTVAVLALAAALTAVAQSSAAPRFPRPVRTPVFERVGGRAATTPTVAIGPTGITYLAWNTETGVGLCRIASRSMRCRSESVIHDGIDGFREPPLLSARADGAVRLVSCDAAGSPVLFESSDSGRRFERAGPLGHGQFFGGAFGPGQRLLLTNDEDGLSTLVTDRSGSDRSRAGYTIHDPAVLEDSGAAAWAGRIPVVTGAVVGRAVAWHWTGRGSAADRHDWVREQLAPAEHTAMAPGPRGLFLLQDGANPDGPDLLRLWRWHHGRFRHDGHLPRAVTSSATDAIALAQDGHGALVAAWDASSAGQLDASVSVDGGRRWSSVRTLAGEVSPVFRLTIGLGRGGRGILAYDSVNGGVWMSRISVAELRRPVEGA
jgi:hypothetical protein